jgi:hypothetical protein
MEPVYHSGDHTSFSQPSTIVDWSIGLSESIRTEMRVLDPGIDSIGVGSSPVFQREIWTEGIPGWIHTCKDTSQTALEQDWVNPQGLELQTEIVARAILRISEMGIRAALPSSILAVLCMLGVPRLPCALRMPYAFYRAHHSKWL